MAFRQTKFRFISKFLPEMILGLFNDAFQLSRYSILNDNYDTYFWITWWIRDKAKGGNRDILYFQVSSQHCPRGKYELHKKCQDSRSSDWEYNTGPSECKALNLDISVLTDTIMTVSGINNASAASFITGCKYSWINFEPFYITV
jgi:hypothetical protein